MVSQRRKPTRAILLALLLVSLIVVKESPMPTELPNTPPSAEDRLRAAVTEAILSFAKDIDTRSGGRIRKISPALAYQMAPLFIKIASTEVPEAPAHFLAYLLATTTQESRNDPEATNPNYTDGSDPAKVDWGIGQLSGVNLLAARVQPERALDYAWSIPRVARIVRQNLEWAEREHPTSDPRYVAALAYNKGRSGAISIIRKRPLKGESWMAFLKRAAAGHAHARSVMGLYRTFEEKTLVRKLAEEVE